MFTSILLITMFALAIDAGISKRRDFDNDSVIETYEEDLMERKERKKKKNGPYQSARIPGLEVKKRDS